MKKIFTLLSILYLIPGWSEAQFETGQQLLGGNLLFSTSSGNSTPMFDNRYIYHNSATGVGINPSIATFRSPSSLRGAGLIYNYNNSTNYSKEDPSDTRNGYKNLVHSAGITIFSQRFIPLSSNLFFTIHKSVTALYSVGKQSDIATKGTAKSKGYGISVSLAPGISYKINSRFLFDAYLSNLLSAGYTHTTTTTNYPLPKETKTRSNSFNVSSSLSNTSLGNVGLGFRWLLRRK